MKLINVIASLALVVATSACSKEEKKNEQPAAAPVTSAAPAEGAPAAQALADKMAAEMGGKALEMAGQAAAAAAVAEDQAAAANDLALAAGDQAVAAAGMAEAAAGSAQAGADSAKAAADLAAAGLPADFGDQVTKAMNDIAAAAESTKGDCTKIVATMTPVMAKHKATFEMMSKTKESEQAMAWMMANMAQLQKLQTAMMPLAMCAMKDPKIAEFLNQMK